MTKYNSLDFGKHRQNPRQIYADTCSLVRILVRRKIPVEGVEKESGASRARFSHTRTVGGLHDKLPVRSVQYACSVCKVFKY